MIDPRQNLRRLLRARRSALPSPARAAASQAIRNYIATRSWIGGASRIGLYVSVAPEVATAALRSLAKLRHCRVYLPRIVDYRRRRMLFYPDDGAPRPNRFGIGEPHAGAAVDVRGLSVLFLPLLGFDGTGTRLGGGQGYYDRLLHFKRLRTNWHRPLLVGLGFACQRLPSIERCGYDVPLDAIVTEAGIETFPGAPRHETLAVED